MQRHKINRSRVRRSGSQKQKARKTHISQQPEYQALEPRMVLNAVPMATDDPFYTTPAATALTVPVGNSVLLNDFDADGLSMTAVLLSGPSNQLSFTLNPNGSFNYIPAAGFQGIDSFYYRAKVGTSTFSRSVRVQIAVGNGLSGNHLRAERISDNGLHSGNLTLIQPLTDGMQLNYRSDSLGTAIVPVETFLTPGTVIPNSIKAQLTFGGVDQGTVNYSTSGLTTGTPLRFAIQAKNLATGMFNWQMNITLEYSSSSIVRSFSGIQAAVNRTASEFGRGWWFDGYDRLHIQSGMPNRPDGLLLVEGDGTTLWFGKSGSTWVYAEGDLNFNAATSTGSGSSTVYTLTDKWGNTRTFDYTGRITAIKRINNNVASYTYSYDSMGRLETITDEFNRDYDLTYSSTTDYIIRCGGFGSGRHTGLTVDSSGTLTSVESGKVDAVVIQHNRYFDGYDYATSTWVYTYNSSTLLCEARIAPGRTAAAQATFEFDSFGLLKQVNNEDGTTNWKLYSTLSQGLKSASVLSPPTYPYYPVSSVDARYTDERGHTFHFTTDRFGNITSTEDPLGATTVSEHDYWGHLYRHTGADPDGVGTGSPAPITVYGYNYRASPLLRINPDSTTITATQHGTLQLPLVITDELGHTTTNTYDSVGNLLTTKDAENYLWTFAWNTHGNLTSQTSPDPDGISNPLTSLVTTFEYESVYYNRLNKITNPDSTYRTFAYTAVDLVNSVTDEIGRTTTYSWDEMDRIVLISLPIIGTATPQWKYKYGTATTSGRQLEFSIDPEDNKTSYLYDARDRLTKITYPDPDGSTTTLSSPVIDYVYNGTSQVTSVTNPTYGTSLLDSYTYDDLGRMLTATGPLSGQTTTYNYDLRGRVIDVTDASGRKIEYRYDIRDRLEFVEDHDPDGTGSLNRPTTEYNYDAAGRLESVVDPLGRITSYEYLDNNWLELVRLPDSDRGGPLARPVYSQAYDALGRQISSTDPLGRVTSYEYDLRSRLENVISPDPTGGSSTLTTSYTYDDVGRLKTMVDPQNFTTTYEWNKWDQMIRIELPDPDGGSGSQVAPDYEYTYDLVGNLETATDARGAVTSYVYDKLYRMTQMTLPNDGYTTPVWNWEYYNNTLLKKTTDPLGRQTTYEYDTAGRLEWIKAPLSRDTQFTYDLLNRQSSVTTPDPDGVGTGGTASTTTYGYDIYSRLTSITNPNSGVTSQAWDDAWQLTSLTDPTGNQTRWAYDGLGRVSMETNSLGDTRGYQYDQVGNLTRVADRNSRITTYSYDNLNRLQNEDWYFSSGGASLVTAWTVTQGNGSTNEVQKFGVYGSNSQTIRLAFGGETTAPISLVGLTDTQKAAAVEAALEGLNSIDNVSVTLASGQYTVTFLGAQANTNVEQIFGDVTVSASASHNRTLNWDYDNSSRLIAASDPSASYGYTLDNLGRTTTETQTVGGLNPTIELGRTFDANGNRTMLTAKIGTTKDFVNDYSFDSHNRLSLVTQQDQSGGNGVTDKRIAMFYNALGQFTTITRYQALTASGQPNLRSVFTYDGANRLEYLYQRSFTSAGVMTTENSYQYTYDKMDRVTQINSQLDGVSNYQHDKLNQLTDGSHAGVRPDEDYQYDANGNRTNTGYSTGGNNRMTSDGTFNYGYNNEGNRVTKTKILDNSYEAYTYDHRNRLTRVEFKNSSNTVLKTVDYSYDVFNRLVKRTVDLDGPGAGTPSDQYFAGYDGISPTLEFDGPNTADLVHRYLWGQVVDQLLADEEIATAGAAGNTLWPMADHLGTIRDIADLNEGTNLFSIANHRVYDSFGNLTAETDTDVDLSFTYTGKFLDDQTGYSLHWNRWLDPATGKWLSEDPIGFAGGDANLGRYVGNAVTRLVDVTGLEQEKSETQDGLTYVKTIDGVVVWRCPSCGKWNVEDTRKPDWTGPSGKSYRIIPRQELTIEILFWFDGPDPTDGIKAEVNRIFQDLMERFARNDLTLTHKLNIEWKQTDKADLEKLADTDLGYSGGWGMGGWDPTRIKVVLRDSLKLQVPGQAGAGRFRANLNPEALLKAAKEANIDNLEHAFATVIAHELGLHAIGRVSDHFSESGFIDSSVGSVGGVFSDKGAEIIAGRMGVDD